VNRTQVSLLLLVSIEMLVGGWAVSRHLYRPRPPIPDLTEYNPYTSQQITDLAEQVDPDTATDWADLADVYLAHGLFPESESCFRRAVELKPRDAELLYRWGFCLSSMGQLEEARQRLRDALTAGYDPPADCWYLIGRTELRSEHVEEALAAFEQASKLAAARFELAKVDVRAGRAEAGISILTQLATELPNAFRPHLLRAQAEAMLGNDSVAANYLDLAEVCSAQLPTPTHEFRKRILATLDSHSVTELVNRSIELLDSRQVDQADALLQTAVGSYWDADVEDVRASVELHRGNLREHRQQLEAIAEQDGMDSYRMWRIGLALSAADQPADAAQAHLAAVTLNTDARANDSLEQLAIVYQKLGDHQHANHYAARFRFSVAMQLFRQAKLIEARSVLRQSVGTDDKYPHTWFYLGEIERYLGNTETASGAYSRCLELAPDYGRAVAARERIEK